MKIWINFTLVIAMAFTSFTYGQQVKGIATYKTQRKLDIKLDSTQISGEMAEQMMAMMKKQFEKEFTLEFTEDEAVYKEVENLDSPTAGGGSFQIVIAGTGGNNVLYTNLKEQRFANQNEFFGKEFLVQDALEPLEWKLEKETKNIGEYTCFKATYTTTRTVMSSVSTSDGEEESSSDEQTEEEVTVTAWYTPQIPVKSGPRNYQGLPGLILEVSDGSETILCSKIVMNPEDGVNIKEPTKGKKVDQATYDEIVQKKMDEMNEQYQGDGRKRGNGNSFQIRIGG